MSPRYATPVALILLLALLPTAIHSYVGLRVEDHLTTAAIPTTLEGFVGAKTSRRANWGEKRFDATDWTERTYFAGSQEVRLLVARSFDLKKLYHHPELAAADGIDLRPLGLTQLGDGLGAVHALGSTDSGRRQIALYALVYDGVLIDNPLWFQFRTSGKLLVTGRKQMTLFFVHQADVPEGLSAEQTAAATVLKAAVKAFVGQQDSAPTHGE
jgi:hypothetical protein